MPTESPPSRPCPTGPARRRHSLAIVEDLDGHRQHVGNDPMVTIAPSPSPSPSRYCSTDLGGQCYNGPGRSAGATHGTVLREGEPKMSLHPSRHWV